MWDAIEADFMRDYRIDLVEQLENMSWRRFLVLLHNLTPYGSVAIKAHELSKEPAETTKQDDEAAANAFFASVVSFRG